MRLAFVRRGSGPQLVLLHPLGATTAVWDPLMDRLTSERDVIAFDLPGFGGSPTLGDAEPPTPAALARAVAASLDELAPGRPVHVAGNSLGGWIALELGLEGRARSVTAIAPAGLWPAPLAPKRGIGRRFARTLLPVLPVALRFRSARRALLLATVHDAAKVPCEAALELVRSYAMAASAYTAVNREMRAGVFCGLGRIRVPVTLAWPQFDRLIPRPRHLPATVHNVTLAGCGHVPMWDDPDQVANVLLTGSAHG